MIKEIILWVFSLGWLGYLSGTAGFTVLTWQYWLFTAPVILYIVYLSCRSSDLRHIEDTIRGLEGGE